MDTIEYILRKFNPEITKKLPFKLHNINRTIMAHTLGELGFKEGAEIGVAQGWHAKVLCENNPGVKLHAIDVWGRYDGYREYTDRIDKYYIEAQERLAPFNVDMIKAFSMDAVKQFADKSLDFVYIDGAHDFKNVAMDVYEWSKKVKPGGIVFGHDYKRWIPGKSKYIVDVKDVIQAYMYTKAVNPWFELTNDVSDPTFGRDNPGWMFVRQEKDWIW